MFSTRIPDDIRPNRLTTVLEQRRQAGERIIDLTLSNPTRADLAYPRDLLASLGDARGLIYRPNARGLAETREAVAADYMRRGSRVAPERVVVTASTSDAYSLLFKVLCNPGDEVLIPHPSYPLFEHLTRLDAVVPVPYVLEYHGTWRIDMGALARAMSSRTRVLLAVSPNNPTGSYVKRDELADVERLCARHGVALVVDEVFADYRLDGERGLDIGDPLACTDALVFALGGLSKSIGLPQAKLGWVGVAGPPVLVAAAVARLEFACDTYLSVSTPVQMAAADLLHHGASIRASIQQRVMTNFRHLAELVTATPSCRLLDAEGGWYGVLRVPTLCTEEELVISLLRDEGILVHPGYFFDFPQESYLVLSLLTPTSDLEEGARAILGRFDPDQRRHFDCKPGRHV